MRRRLLISKLHKIPLDYPSRISLSLPHCHSHQIKLCLCINHNDGFLHGKTGFVRLPKDLKGTTKGWHGEGLHNMICDFSGFPSTKGPVRHFIICHHLDWYFKAETLTWWRTKFYDKKYLPQNFGLVGEVNWNSSPECYVWWTNCQNDVTTSICFRIICIIESLDEICVMKKQENFLLHPLISSHKVIKNVLRQNYLITKNVLIHPGTFSVVFRKLCK